MGLIQRIVATCVNWRKRENFEKREPKILTSENTKNTKTDLKRQTTDYREEIV